jgi:hypothetical protein
MTHNCLLELPSKGHDGQIRSCSCGNRWCFTKDERLGNYWLPHVVRNGREHHQATVTKAMRKRISEAQKAPYISGRK